jgi:hypothetical protein
MNPVVLIALQAVLTTIATIVFCMSVYYFVIGIRDIRERRYLELAKLQYTAFSTQSPMYKSIYSATQQTAYMLTGRTTQGTFPQYPTYHHEDTYLDF